MTLADIERLRRALASLAGERDRFDPAEQVHWVNGLATASSALKLAERRLRARNGRANGKLTDGESASHSVQRLDRRCEPIAEKGNEKWETGT